MKATVLHRMFVGIVAITLLSGFDVKGVGDKLGGSKDDCSKSDDPKKCRKKQDIKDATKVIAIGVAAKLVYDMVVAYRSSQTRTEEQIVDDYKKTNKTLPAEPAVVEYTTQIKPGEVVKAGNEVLVQSSLVVVPGAKSQTVDIQEKMDIYDNEKNDQLLKTLTKPVNEKSKKSGAFKNEFKFTLPQGLPQGTYPIKTLVLVNGKAAKPTANKMQLVLNVDGGSRYTLASIHR